MIEFKAYYSKCDSVARLITSFHLLERDGIIKLKFIENTGTQKRIPFEESLK